MISGENEYGPAGRRPRRKIPAAVAVLSSPHSGHPAERLVSGSFSAFRPGLDTGWHYPGGWHVARTDLGIRTLRDAGTTIRPDKPAAKLVTDGPFRFSRNPLYLALTLMYAGIALMADSIWALLLLFPVTFIMTRFVIQREEDYLARTFGEDYERYKKSVRRWI
jgi:hypothetical protein